MSYSQQTSMPSSYTLSHPISPISLSPQPAAGHGDDDDSDAVPEFTRIVCGACHAPNSLEVSHCSKCGAAVSPTTCALTTSPCPFCLLVAALDAAGAVGHFDPPLAVGNESVHYADSDVVVFDAFHAASWLQLNIIPRHHVAHLAELDSSPDYATAADRKALLVKLYTAGMAVTERLVAVAAPPWAAEEVYYPTARNPDITFTAAYNMPPSVPHLHLYIIATPYQRPMSFMRSQAVAFPRSKTHAAVLNSLDRHGRCIAGKDREAPEYEAEERAAHAVDVARIVSLHVERTARLHAAATSPKASDVSDAELQFYLGGQFEPAA
ncbi:uncharacterized protein AMSG_05467 [Thecamonas trahens ATCC 50062]|uniref:HIT domain-containing protein n=1 Tax=Thecamonas trahens ATCC 50062 TaxID=461836 RepID=A0A0L0DDS1_THETB|nr:hypothetical protein AMSG_05467 [Thecamonas trahens ATCC 50062]KNC49458.1 hypothetical protein AMSG_05467 [Thecamonas trahens ATCC 50062]|eukprot:XP_013757878.1 hypothetical protein AMSG_05467 [Thecamonas trahens ATCC 50062]